MSLESTLSQGNIILEGLTLNIYYYNITTSTATTTTTTSSTSSTTY